MLWELIAVGGILFWLLTAAAIILILWAVSDDDSVFKPLLFMAAYIAIVHFFGNAAWATLALANPGTVAIYIGIYFGVGILWSLFKWVFFVRGKSLEYSEAKKRFLTRKNVEDLTVVPEELRQNWKETVDSHLLEQPTAARNKRKIISWMAYWPFSIVWTIIRDPWEYIYDALASLFNAISKSIYRGTNFEEDTKVPSRERRMEIASANARRVTGEDPPTHNEQENFDGFRKEAK
jgi:hypothetical protein